MRHFLLLLAFTFHFSLISLSAEQTQANQFVLDQEKELFDTKLKVFPNPVTGKTFQVTAKKEIETILVTNLLGQKAVIDSNKKNESHFSVTLTKKVAGIYLVTVSYSDETKEVKQIIVK